MACSTGPTPFKFLLIRAPAEQTLIDYNVPTRFRSGQYIKLPVAPNEYARIIEGERSKFTDTFSKTFFSPRLARVGFKLNSSITEYPLIACIEHIAKIALSTSYSNFTAIQIIDSVRPEEEDYQAQLAADPTIIASTTRYGLINFDETSGLIGFNNEVGTDTGFGFTFLEYDKRLVV